MKKTYSYSRLIQILKECRNVLIDDTLASGSPDLYDALLSDYDSDIFKIKLELYELEWIELHWIKVCDSLNDKNYSQSEKMELLAIFSDWYRSLVSNWSYTNFDADLFEERIKILKSLISINNKWDINIKRMKVSFEKNKKVLKNKIYELEQRGILDGTT